MTVERTKQSSDVSLEERLGAVLRVGVYASSICLFAGLLMSLTAPGLAALASWLMTAGLVMLMATPVTRVAVSVIEYGLQRDWTFFTLTGLVLLELAAGIVTALLFHTKL